MKLFPAILAFLFINFAVAANPPAAPQAPSAPSVTGEVLEVKDVESYTYLRLKTKDGEVWAAVTKASVKKGEQVTIENSMVMTNFESKSLKKTFDKIVFGNLGGSGAKPAAAAPGMAVASAMTAKAPEAADVKVPKATGPDARTVAEVATKRTELKDKTVLVRGKVVKYNEGVMGKNWVHLRDGSGTASDGSNDLLVTTMDKTKLGEIVSAKGVVRLDKDFGAGYAYKVLVEDGKLQK
jgi:DNA/RNA endonuclease YhcR with UshA esterase domain